MKSNRKSFKFGNIRIYCDLSGNKVAKTIVRRGKIEIHVNPQRVKPYIIKRELEHAARLYRDKVLRAINRKKRKRKSDWLFEIVKFKEQDYVIILNPWKLLEGNKS